MAQETLIRELPYESQLGETVRRLRARGVGRLAIVGDQASESAQLAGELGLETTDCSSYREALSVRQQDTAVLIPTYSSEGGAVTDLDGQRTMQLIKASCRETLASVHLPLDEQTVTLAVVV